MALKFWYWADEPVELKTSNMINLVDSNNLSLEIHASMLFVTREECVKAKIRELEDELLRVRGLYHE